MLYYSKKTKQMYETVDALEEAEKAYDAEKAERERQAAERKSRADEVRKAYEHAQEIRRAAAEMITEADKEYYALQNKFVQDYKVFHSSVYETRAADDNVIGLLGTTLAAWFL